jgi:CBS-domain-containing membrane protein
MLVQEVMSAGLVTAKKTDTVRSAVIKMMNRHCGAIPVVEGDARFIGMVTLREVLLPLSRALGVFFPRFKNKC